MIDPEIQLAEKIYKEKFQSFLEPTLKGKYIAIDIASGEYFIGDEILEAYQKANQKYPDRTFVFKRIGYLASRFIGSH